MPAQTSCASAMCSTVVPFFSVFSGAVTSIASTWNGTPPVSVFGIAVGANAISLVANGVDYVRYRTELPSLAWHVPYAISSLGPLAAGAAAAICSPYLHRNDADIDTSIDPTLLDAARAFAVAGVACNVIGGVSRSIVLSKLLKRRRNTAFNARAVETEKNFQENKYCMPANQDLQAPAFELPSTYPHSRPFSRSITIHSTREDSSTVLLRMKETPLLAACEALISRHDLFNDAALAVTMRDYLKKNVLHSKPEITTMQLAKQKLIDALEWEYSEKLSAVTKKVMVTTGCNFDGYQSTRAPMDHLVFDRKQDEKRKFLLAIANALPVDEPEVSTQPQLTRSASGKSIHIDFSGGRAASTSTALPEKGRENPMAALTPVAHPQQKGSSSLSK